LGLGVAIGKTIAGLTIMRNAMVNVPDAEGSHDSNFPVHVRNYRGFMTIMKWSLILVAIITAIVLYVISN
jgi:hypothetical protein